MVNKLGQNCEKLGGYWPRLDVIDDATATWTEPSALAKKLRMTWAWIVIGLSMSSYGSSATRRTQWRELLLFWELLHHESVSHRPIFLSLVGIEDSNNVDCWSLLRAGIGPWVGAQKAMACGLPFPMPRFDSDNRSIGLLNIYAMALNVLIGFRI